MLVMAVFYLKLWIHYILWASFLSYKILILMALNSIISSPTSSTPPKLFFTFIPLTLFLLSPHLPPYFSLTFISLTLIFHFKTFNKTDLYITIINISIFNIHFIANAYSLLYIPPTTYETLKKVLKTLLTFSGFLLVIMFSSYQQFFFGLMTALITLFLSSLIIMFNVYSLIFENNKTPFPLNSHPFPYSLKTRQDQSLIKATVEEEFFEELLDLDEPYSTYPIFFKSSFPVRLTKEQEFTLLWKSIRWTSALSKHSGLASSFWSLKTSKSFQLPPSHTFSVHAPIIPVFNHSLFKKLQELNFPTIDATKIPPHWNPYSHITKHYNWPSPSLKPERLNEMEEEDW